ncbi:cation:proton antiporter domain-containing protein [Hoyosella subflava]|uniref:Sodium/hydrogen exchanger n=1 Tax=Hoyosella subflava (strain DSM 45089 / JCM 17490 / NBRC 109087 / DQS3-9A1) TaxID=443218 RepID=F6EQP6_HOYSD|nr:cation:proton antiporter [Hoyosella subflava]AEF41923.1 Sodium/hydrogen exchanger [Hoyosella subflava DQS3-9A1]
MNISLYLAVFGGLSLIIAAFSASLRKWPVSEPMLGLLAGALLGPQFVGALYAPEDSASLLREAANLLLAVSVMGVALQFPLRTIRTHTRPLLILLLVAMPLMAAIAAGIGWAILGVPLVACALLGASLCPTDPVLASNVVGGRFAERDVPQRTRQLLLLESGANDGLALPLVLVAIALTGVATAGSTAIESLWQLSGAVVVGVITGWCGGKALRAGERHGSTESGPMLFFAVTLAVGILGLSDLVHTDGVLAVFVGGLAFSFATTGREREAEVRIDEAVNRFAVLPLFMLLGMSLPWQDWKSLGVQGLIFAAAVLVLRRLPVILLLAKALKLRLRDAVYLGWFGPIGVAALFYLLLIDQRIGLDSELYAAGTLVIAVSTVVFGLTAASGRVLYRRASGGAAEDSAVEDEVMDRAD